MIQVGQVLDKYELLERVGQGGMAIVYRGIDRSLKRTVAIKILHKHLSDYQEARDRFEREAQAVAKLRHENILEIFDYSAKEGSESYIVTEFIDGQTLKQFVTERPIAYPEIGAMIILQVCRALAHAHAGSILHRDVKPENIMIRSDGVVKLMDFGISHMVDLERLTVTGQLLGSPAYMAPEHVEGRPLDFRTDVFAAGIVLYQLCVGKLPFEGKNPHEVLKRIAECKFIDPRQANPRIGNRLGRIILRAMAQQPNDRYPAIGEMVIALEAYLDESGLPGDKIPGELCRYFQAPGAYEQGLKIRLVDTLTRNGQHKLEANDQAGALDIFDRVLTIDPENAKVLAILDRINRRARMKTVLVAMAALVAIGGGGFLIHEKTKPPPPEPPNFDLTSAGMTTSHDLRVSHVENPPPMIDAAIEPADATRVSAIAVDARVEAAVPIDATVQLAAIPIEIRVSPSRDSTFSIDGGPPQRLSGTTFAVEVHDHPVKVEVSNTCCQSKPLSLDRASDPKQTVSLDFLPGSVLPTCGPNTSVSINGVTATLGQKFLVGFESHATSSMKTVTVVFTGGTHASEDRQSITVTAGKPQDVKCAVH